MISCIHGKRVSHEPAQNDRCDECVDQMTAERIAMFELQQLRSDWRARATIRVIAAMVPA